MADVMKQFSKCLADFVQARPPGMNIEKDALLRF